MNQDFYVVIEKDEDGYFVGEVPALRGCYSQGKTIEELMQNMKEVIEMCQLSSATISSHQGKNL
ncbi:type II toxin-antitoxin system HicB family antitoxin [Desulfonatronovibrio magnus]|uniref:type II toxin-antitoxin system HicB family antitoxin n=1 Tax=Desulfonatronovibrio magnus TaxID=698827 RepID=UPI0005EBEF2D|nr:type II toxin-antitoxin system HicB family antitoxin [Desulfonatronovibrio magnus]